MTITYNPQVTDHVFNALEAVIWCELVTRNKPLSGYDIHVNIANVHGLKWSHQQVYRTLHRMPLTSKTIPQDGKPDRVEYLRENVEVTFDVKSLPIDVIEVYGLVDYIPPVIDRLETERLSIINHPQMERNPKFRAYDIARLTHDINYLLELQASLTEETK